MTTDVRLDKWLWAARLFKTRALAADAVAGGHVQVDGARVKPAKAVRVGATLTVRRGDDTRTLVVRGLGERRRPAPEAALLYEETEASRARRAAEGERRRARLAGAPARAGRPDKQARRASIRLSRGS